MSKLLVFTILISLMALTACKKDKNVITGTLTDMSSGEVISGAIVDLYYNEVSSGSFNPIFKHLTTTTTDASGNYRLEFESKLYVKLKITYTKENYHNRSIEFDPDGVLNSYTKNVKLPMESYLRVDIKRIYPSGHDKVVLKIDGINPDCDMCCDDDTRNYSGESVDESFICPVVGGDIIMIEVINGYSKINENIECTVGDTVLFQYFY